MKTCTRCGATKPLTEFRVTDKKYGYLRSHCNPCNREWQRERYVPRPRKRQDPEVRKAKQAAGHKRYMLRRRYGLSWDEYQAMLVQQKGECAICKTHLDQRALNVDHNHETGQVRGLLCNGCNRAIGFMNESPERLAAAIRYLRKWNRPS